MNHGRSRFKTTEQFILDAQLVHSNQYDYSECVYVNAKQKVTIICREHGVFTQKPNGHLGGKGCRECGIQRMKHAQLLTSSEFVIQARQVHGDLYDYSHSVYQGAHRKLTIICPSHGPFEQTPQAHKKGCGCLQCGWSKAKPRLTTVEFIQKAHQKHGLRYAYEKSEYNGFDEPVMITCIVHGDFLQTPHNHLSGHGCPLCANNLLKTTSEFVSEAVSVHGATYDYSQVHYVNSTTKIAIICQTHGVFFQDPALHLYGHGCPECGRESTRKSLCLTSDEFIIRARAIHGGYYQYENCAYEVLRTSVTITCPVHGDFEQVAGTHLDGSGCPRCRMSSGERAVELCLEGMDMRRGIHFVNQKTLPGCRIHRLMPFDFGSALASDPWVIEYHGIQHYQPVSHWSQSEEQAVENYDSLRIRDDFKLSFCLKNGVRILVIPYWEKHLIPDKLVEFFGGQPLGSFSYIERTRT